MRYEILLDEFYDGVRIRTKGEVIEFHGDLSPKIAKPLDRPQQVEQEQTPRQNRRMRNTH